MNRGLRIAIGVGVAGLLCVSLVQAAPPTSTAIAIIQFWKLFGTHIYNTNSGNVGIGTGPAVPAQKLEVVGSIKVTGAGSSIVFADGSTQTTAVAGGGGGVPSGFSILGDISTPPSGYTFTNKTVDVGDTWAMRTPMPTNRISFAVATINNKIYVIGGTTGGTGGGTVLATVEEYDPMIDTWATKASMPTARSASASVSLNGKIYVIGGRIGNTYVANVEEYDPATDTWAVKTPMPTARANFAAASANGKISAMGGMIDVSATGTAVIEEYDPASDTWIAKPPMPIVRCNFGAVAINSTILAMGGTTSTGTGACAAVPGLNAVDEYDPVNNTWTPKAPLFIPQVSIAPTELGGKILAVWTNGLPLNQEYDAVNNAWTLKAPPPAMGLGGGTLVAGANGKLYAIGANPSNGVNVNQEYTPSVVFYIHKKD